MALENLILWFVHAVHQQRSNLSKCTQKLKWEFPQKNRPIAFFAAFIQIIEAYMQVTPLSGDVSNFKQPKEIVECSGYWTDLILPAQLQL